MALFAQRTVRNLENASSAVIRFLNAIVPTNMMQKFLDGYFFSSYQGRCLEYCTGYTWCGLQQHESYTRRNFKYYSLCWCRRFCLETRDTFLITKSGTCFVSMGGEKYGCCVEEGNTNRTSRGGVKFEDWEGMDRDVLRCSWSVGEHVSTHESGIFS